ncbi:hypothetical protein CC78DRAFT_534825 [Lojkania enalia]|uniref:CYTH domain-containing protein n=1 Tax=Lojkania enalia TaxID=147567 RepID=A0A9P4K5R2_9PLEO|nr:hypothetical protein CC78DRAFT_534825 [Didymosphaeria enalia]
MAPSLPPSMRPHFSPVAKSLHVLEVERKFAPTTESLARLRANNGEPRFALHHPLPIIDLHDIYYDCGNTLMRKGIYVRLRNGKWGAKVRVGGDYINSRFKEYHGVGEVENILRGVGNTKDKFQGARVTDLLPVVEFKAKRESWNIDGFKVVVDEVDFGHRVGEVELCQSFDLSARFALSKDGRGMEKAGEKMDFKIETFMQVHKWAFPKQEGEVMGKLTAYFRWKDKVGKSEG